MLSAHWLHTSTRAVKVKHYIFHIFKEATASHYNNFQFSVFYTTTQGHCLLGEINAIYTSYFLHCLRMFTFT